MFGDFLIENHSTNNNSIGKFCDITLSTFKYSFSVDEINKFKKFKREIINKGVLTNPLYRLATNSFMRGVNKAFYYEIDGLDRIVDYTIALESLFLADNAHYFLGSTIGKRVSKFLNDGDSSKIVKYMYNERSNIVHGNYLDLDSDKIDKRMKKIKERMCSFEDIMRKILRKMYDHNFENLNSLILYIEGLYKLPDKSLEIMLEAKKKAEKYLSC